MLNKIDMESLSRQIAEMSREDVQFELLHFDGSFDLDFPETYLQEQSAEKLRHILLAAKLQQLRYN